MLKESSPGHTRLPAPGAAHETETLALGSILEGLGIYGLAGVDDILLAALVTADPLLMIGQPGSAKTLLALRLAKALGLCGWAYDASKALFEDMIGFPSPAALALGRVEYVPTELSLFDKEFILVDEVSRASPATANKWLEVIRSRRIMGLPLPRLQHIFGAMNPPGATGTNPLEEALADRFSWVLRLPEAGAMGEDDLRRIVTALSEDDAPALYRAKASSNGVDLRAVLDSARQAYRAIEAGIGRPLADYVVRLCPLLTAEKVRLTGRRCGMIYRNILALLAVRGRHPADIADIEDDIFFAVSNSLPHAAMGVEVRETVLHAAHGEAMLRNETPAPGWWDDDPIRMTKKYLAVRRDLDVPDHHEVISALEGKLTSATPPATAARAHVALLWILCAVQRRKARLPSDVQMRCAEAYNRIIRVTAPWNDSAVSALARRRAASGRGVRRLELTSLALTLNLYFESGKHVSINPTPDGEIERIYDEIYRELKSLIGEDRP